MPRPGESFSSIELGAFCDAVAGDDPTPGGGAVAGVVAGLAAGLTAMAGRYALRRAPESEQFRALVERADDLRRRALKLADMDAEAYGRYIEASGLSREPDPEPRRRALQAALDAAADVPFHLAQLAVEVAAAGEELAASGNPRLRSDACTATVLASAAATSAAIFVAENLRSHPDDPRLADAVSCAAGAAAAAARVLARFGATGLANL